MSFRKHESCTVQGCTNKHAAHGFCSYHEWRWRRYGDPLAGPIRPAEDWLDWVVVWRLLHDHGRSDLTTLLGRHPTRAEYRAGAWVMRRDGHSVATIATYLHKSVHGAESLLKELDLVNPEELLCVAS